MLKLLICLFCALLMGVVILEMRQQRLDLNFQTNRLHNQIEAQQARLWSQQVQIAIYTAPNAIAKTVGANEMKMVPQSPLPGGGAWGESSDDSAAE